MVRIYTCSAVGRSRPVGYDGGIDHNAFLDLIGAFSTLMVAPVAFAAVKTFENAAVLAAVFSCAFLVIPCGMRPRQKFIRLTADIQTIPSACSNMEPATIHWPTRVSKNSRICAGFERQKTNARKYVTPSTATVVSCD
jgi:hypothetical protein